MVLVFVEHDNGVPKEESLEAVTAGRRVAHAIDESLTAIVVGDAGDETARDLGEYGVESMTVITNDALTPYAPDGWARAIQTVNETDNAAVVMAAGIERSQEILARFAADTAQPMAANCMEIEPGDPHTVIRQRWGGSLLEEATIAGDPTILTTTPREIGAEPAPDETEPSVEHHDIELNDDDLRVTLTRTEKSDIEGVPLGEARVVVGGGRGAGGPDGFEALEELAEILGGTVGSSRAAVNEGWRPHDDQIGLTGAKISPDLYIPCGISGAVQHWVGCKAADRILAINTDREAAIIQKSDWAVIGDMHEIVPEIIAELESRGHA